MIQAWTLNAVIMYEVPRAAQLGVIENVPSITCSLTSETRCRVSASSRKHA